MNSVNGAYNQSVPVTLASDLDNALSGLDSAGGALHCCIDSLEERLGALLAPRQSIAPSAACTETADPQSVQPAPLIAKLKNQTGIVGSAADRISSLLSRLCS